MILYCLAEVIPFVPQELPPEMTKWDLSIPNLLKVQRSCIRTTSRRKKNGLVFLQIIMDVEDETAREEKLKQLNQLVGTLSFPPPPTMKTSPYHLW